MFGGIIFIGFVSEFVFTGKIANGGATSQTYFTFLKHLSSIIFFYFFIDIFVLRVKTVEKKRGQSPIFTSSYKFRDPNT